MTRAHIRRNNFYHAGAQHLHQEARRACRDHRVHVSPLHVWSSVVVMFVVLCGVHSCCPVCNLPFNDAAFVRYPNGTVTHLKCGKNKSICPVTGTWFSGE